MGQISNITIKNIKVFSDRDNSIDVDIKSGKINILVAPNGYGKSSITAAFKSLTNSRIKVERKDIHNEDEHLDSVLSIIEDDIQYTADRNKNELVANHFKVAVINSRLVAKATGRNMGAFHSVQGHLGISDFEVIYKIPKSCEISYNWMVVKKDFGRNGKVLPNISSLFRNKTFLSKLDCIYKDLDKQSDNKRKNMINSIVKIINELKGTADVIKNNLDKISLDRLEGDSSYKKITELIGKYTDVTELDMFLYFYQLQRIYFSDKSKFKLAVKRAKYEVFRKSFDNNLMIIGKTWKDIHTVEHKGSLVIKMPNAASISYGQRDVLTLCIELQKIIYEIKAGSKLIFIIDEVFDYLDPVNMTIVQYYLSQMIEEFKSNCTLYPIIMTHLSPEYFYNYTFSTKRMNIVYLQKDHIVQNIKMTNLLSKRSDNTIKEDVDKYLMHYNIKTINKRRQFRQLGLAETWGEGTIFLEHLITEINKYLREDNDYDPYSVCIALRLRIEKSVYEQLPTDESKTNFLNTHKTKAKLEFAESIIGELPDIYFILGIIYNDAVHIKDENFVKPIVYRLKNTTIRDMIGIIFGYKKGEELTLDVIH